MQVSLLACSDVQPVTQRHSADLSQGSGSKATAAVFDISSCPAAAAAARDKSTGKLIIDSWLAQSAHGS